MRNSTLLLASFGVFAGGSVTSAKPIASESPVQVQRLMGCRTIIAADERLACYDRETAAVGQALANQDLFIADKAKARAAGRSLFGFSIPNFGGLFGNNDDIRQVEGTIRSAGHNADGGWTVTLDDGSVWTQTDDWPGFEARRGEKVVVKRGALGSFWLSAPGKNGIKVKRIA